MFAEARAEWCVSCAIFKTVFSWVSDVSLSNYFWGDVYVGTRPDSTRRPWRVSSSLGHPVRVPLTTNKVIRKSNILHKIQKHVLNFVHENKHIQHSGQQKEIE